MSLSQKLVFVLRLMIGGLRILPKTQVTLFGYEFGSVILKQYKIVCVSNF